jgi:outer membrane protein
MRKIVLLIFACIALTANAQETTQTATPATIGFGYLSYNRALQQMPGYDEAQQSLLQLRTQYNAELRRVEEDFNRKYEEFLEGRADFPPTILRKRQTELQEMMDRNIAFRDQSRRELADAEEKVMEPLRKKLREAIALVAQQQGFAFVLNTDSDACPYINPLMGKDISDDVSNQLE